MKMKTNICSFFVFFVCVVSSCFDGSGYAQTLDEMKFTIKRLETENKKLNEDLRKAQKKAKSKSCTEYEDEINRLEREIVSLRGENLELKEKVKEEDDEANTAFELLEISDPLLKDYLLRYCDMDNDGVLSQWDANHTYVINLKNESKTNIFKDVTELDLDGLKYFTNLKKLVCSGNTVVRMNLSNNVDLETLIVNNCDLRTIDVSKNVKLKHLECNGNALYVIDLQNNPDLEYIDVSKNQLNELSLQNCKNITTLLCSYNTIFALDVSSNVGLKAVDCSNNRLAQLSFVNNVTIDSICCQNNALVLIDLRNNKNISYLDCSKNNNLETVLISDGHGVVKEKKGKKTYYRYQ